MSPDSEPIRRLIDERDRLRAENATYRELVKQLEEKQSEVRAAIWVLLEYVGIHQYTD